MSNVDAMTSPLLVGFVASFTLIAAIGAQNAFVLRQGIRREHVLPVVALCTVSDIALIAAGIVPNTELGHHRLSPRVEGLERRACSLTARGEPVIPSSL